MPRNETPPRSEGDIGKIAQSEASKFGARVFRNNNGKAYQGDPVRPTFPTKLTVMPGDVLLRKARLIHFGLGDGSGDQIGWRSVTITPDMVGKKIAQFVSFEEKTKRGVVHPDQLKWLLAVQFAGGVAAIIRDPIEDVRIALATEDVHVMPSPAQRPDALT